MYILNNKLKENLSESTIIFDSSAIIQIVESESEKLMDQLQKFNCDFLYLHTVLLEIMRTNNSGLRTRYMAFLAKNKFTLKILPEKFISDMVLEMQKELSKYGCYPSPTDLYLATLLKLYCRLDENRTYLLTANLKDFPKQIFGRVDYVILEGDKGINTLSFLRYGLVNREIEYDDDIPF